MTIDSWVAVNALTTGYGIDSFKVFRVSGFDQKGNALLNLTLQNFTVHLLFDNCEVQSSPPVQTYLGSVVAASPSLYQASVAFNGFVVENAPSEPNMRILFEGSNDGGRTWQPAGSSEMRLLPEGVRLLSPYVVPTGQRRLLIDRRPPWPLFLGAAKTILAGALALAIAACGLGARAPVARCLLVASLLISAASDLAAVPGYCLLGPPREAFLPGWRACLLAAAAAVALAAEPFTPHAALLAALGELAGRAIEDCALYTDCGRLAASPPVLAPVVAVAAALVLRACARILAAAASGAAADRARYDGLWEALASDPAHGPGLAELSDVAARLSAALPCTPVRHGAGCAIPEGSFVVGRDIHSLLNGPGPCPPVRSLDQLYSQALALDGLLHSLCAHWAGRCGGSVAPPAAGGAGRLKPMVACVRKAVAMCGGDASRVTDVCRRRIAVASPSAAAECLRAAAGDRRVLLLRVRNGLRRDHDAHSACGFRVIRPAAAFLAILDAAHGRVKPTEVSITVPDGPAAQAGSDGCKPAPPPLPAAAAAS